MTQSQVLDFTSAFPPAQKLTQKLMQIDYRKQYHNFMDVVVIVCAWIAAITTILRDNWVKYDCTERVQLFALATVEKLKDFYTWVRTVLIPAAVAFYNDVRSLYNVLSLSF